MLDIFTTYSTYLIHPFKTHEALISNDKEYLPRDISLYESLGISWLFIILSAFFKLVVLTFFLSIFLDLSADASELIESVYSGDRYVGFYFVILSTILDAVFFPLITLFVIQFWDLVIKFYAYICGIEGDIDKKSKDILSISLSSNMFVIIPILGDVFQRFAQIIQMYAGLRRQLNFSAGASLCVLLTPYLFLAGFITLILTMIIIKML